MIAQKGANTAAGRYSELSTSRSPYLERGRDSAKLTIPALLPPQGTGGSTELHKPYQSMGADGVNNLAGKLLLALFPPNQSFFRLVVPDSVLSELGAGAGAQIKQQLEEGLARVESEVQKEVETSAVRVSLGELIRHLIVTGNACLQVLPTGKLKVTRLDRYVVKRDPTGEVVEAIIHERAATAALPKDFLAALKRRDEYRRANAQSFVDIYTWLRRDGDMFLIHQEVAGKPVPGSEGSYPVTSCPFLFLRWTKMDGEDYGRSHSDDNFGDLRSLEGLSAAIVEGSSAAAKLLFLVDPMGMTTMDTIANAPNLAIRSGRGADVSTIKTDKASDFAVALSTIQNIERRLSRSYLMTSSIQRNAERVTAEEIRLLAGELEDALGGVYALLSQELQFPYVQAVMAYLTRAKRIPALPKNVKPVIITGLSALGRNHELNRLMMFARATNELLGPGAAARYLKVPAALSTVALSVGLAPAEYVRTEEEVAKEVAAERQQALSEKLGPEVIRARASMSNPNQEATNAQQVPQ
jgi:hypothetical protein